MYPNVIEYVSERDRSGVREIPEPKLSTVSLSTVGGKWTRLVVGVERPDGVSPDASPLRRTRLRRRFKEVLMVRTVVRVIEPSIYVQMFKAPRVTNRPSL